MNLNKRTKLTAIILALLLAVSILPISAFAAFGTSKLTVIHVNDRHGRTSADPYLANMVKDLNEKGENVLLLDAGDSLHGQTVTNLSKGRAMVGIMNTVGYSAMTPGNHDFNFGVPQLLELSKEMNFPLLAANVKDADGKNLFEPYKVFKMNKMTVGVFGIATPETITKSDPRIVAGLTFEDPAVAAAEMVEELKSKKCDVIIALAHLGEDKATSAKNRSCALTKVSGIDVVIDGHSHKQLKYGNMENGVLVAQTGEFGKNIGVVEIVVKNGEIEKSAKTVAVPEKFGSLADKTVVKAIRKEEAKIASVTSAVVGSTPVELLGTRELVRTRETNLSNVITDSMLWATKADIAFLTGGNIRASIDAGDVTMGEILTTLPFSNLLVTVDLTGAEVLKMLEHGVSQYPAESAILIHVAGISFTFDPGASAGKRIKTVTMPDGKALDVNKTYKVATIDFLAAGGDGYTMLANGRNLVYYGGDADALADYIATKPSISSAAEGRISVSR